MDKLDVTYTENPEFHPAKDDKYVSKEFFQVAQKLNEEFPEHCFTYEVVDGCAVEEGKVIFPKDTTISVIMDEEYNVINYTAQNILNLRNKKLDISWILTDLKNCVYMTLDDPELYKILT